MTPRLKKGDDLVEADGSLFGTVIGEDPGRVLVSLKTQGANELLSFLKACDLGMHHGVATWISRSELRRRGVAAK